MNNALDLKNRLRENTPVGAVKASMQHNASNMPTVTTRRLKGGT